MGLGHLSLRLLNLEVRRKISPTGLLGCCLSKVQSFTFLDYSFTFMITSHTQVSALKQVYKSTKNVSHAVLSSALQLCKDEDLQE